MPLAVDLQLGPPAPRLGVRDARCRFHHSCSAGLNIYTATLNIIASEHTCDDLLRLTHSFIPSINDKSFIYGEPWRGDNIIVIDNQRDEVVNVFAGFGAAPDLLDIAPGTERPLPCGPSSTTICYAHGGQRVFIAMRGPNPLTGGEPARGERTGVAVLDVLEGGRSG